MTGAIPRSLMTDAELAAHARDTGEDDDFVPTLAGRAYVELIQAPTLPTGGALAGESTATHENAEGRERPEGDATHPGVRGLLARQPWGLITLASFAVVYLAALTLLVLAGWPA